MFIYLRWSFGCGLGGHLCAWELLLHLKPWNVKQVVLQCWWFLLLSLRSFSFDGWYMCLFFLYLFFYLFGWRIIHVYFFYSPIYSEIPFIEVTDFKHFVGQGDGGYSLCHSWKDGSLLILLNVYIQSLFLLGSIVWPKNSFIKTLISIVLVVFLYNWGVVAFTRFSENSTLSTLILFFFKWGYILFPILTIINWTLTYFRLKESEVIHRI